MLKYLSACEKIRSTSREKTGNKRKYLVEKMEREL
jgi:hypothetical protein